MKSIKKDIQYFVVLFICCVFVNYFLPSIISMAFFSCILILFFIAKNRNNYFWVMLVFLLLTAPGNLFHDMGVRPLPSISVPGFGRSISFGEVFTILALVKAYMSPIKQMVFYRNYLTILIIYSIFLLIWGMVLGFDLFKFLRSVRFIFPFFLLLLIPRLIPYRTVPKMVLLLFTSTSILLFCQIFDRLTGAPVASFFGDFLRGEFVRFGDDEMIRSFYGPTIVLLSIVMSMAMLVENKKRNQNKYLYVISLFAALGVFLSATRGWILAVAILFIGFAFFQGRKIVKYAFYSIFLLGLLLSVPQINNQVFKSLDRFQTLGKLVQGDLTAGGTLGRITRRSPRVMNKFWEQPVFGFGFSEEYYMYSDGHVGNQTLLLNGGIVGYSIYLYFLLRIFKKYHEAYKKGNKPIFIFILGLLGFVVIHSSSRMIFSYSLDTVTALSLGTFFFLSDYYLRFVISHDQKTFDEINKGIDSACFSGGRNA